MFNNRNGVENLKYSCFAKKTSLKDDMGLILTYIGILPFFAAAILKTVQNGGWDPKYRLLTS